MESCIDSLCRSVVTPGGCLYVANSVHSSDLTWAEFVIHIHRFAISLQVERLMLVLYSTNQSPFPFSRLTYLIAVLDL